jgi:hypothetical protein
MGPYTGTVRVPGRALGQHWPALAEPHGHGMPSQHSGPQGPQRLALAEPPDHYAAGFEPCPQPGGAATCHWSLAVSTGPDRFLAREYHTVGPCGASGCRMRAVGSWLEWSQRHAMKPSEARRSTGRFSAENSPASGVLCELPAEHCPEAVGCWPEIQTSWSSGTCSRISAAALHCKFASYSGTAVQAPFLAREYHTVGPCGASGCRMRAVGSWLVESEARDEA